MKPEQGSAAVRALLERAEAIARERGDSEVTSLDLVLAIARDRPGHLDPIFERYGIAPEKVEAEIRKRRPENGGAHAAGEGPLAPAADVAAAVARAGRAAESLGRERVEPEDVLLALLSDRGADGTELLRARFELTRERLVKDLAALRGQERAIARAEGHDACGAHAELPPAPSLDGPTGLAAELRDLDARFRALCENVNALRERQNALVAVVRRLWIGALLLFAILAALAIGLVLPRVR